jgi:hypothetical protein
MLARYQALSGRAVTVRPARGLFLEGFEENRFDVAAQGRWGFDAVLARFRRDFGTERLRVAYGTFELARGGIGDLLRALAGEELVENQAERVDVGRRGDAVPSHLFG